MRKYKLKDVCKVNQGLQIPISMRHSEPGKDRFFYITIQFLKKSDNKNYYVEKPNESVICNENDILVVRTGSTGLVLTGVKGCFHNNFFKVVPDENIIVPRYLYYFLSSQQIYSKMRQLAGVTVIPDLSHGAFYSIELNLPSLERQKEIVDLLDVFNEKIELNSRLIENIEEYSKLLFHKWFVDFNFPNENGEPYKDSGGEMVEVDGKMIPKGWKEVFVSYISDIQYGYPFNSEMFSDFSNENNHGVVRIRDIIENTISAYTSENVDSKYKLKFGDLLIGMDGNFHISNWYLEEAYLNQRVVRIRKSSIHNVSTLHIKLAISKQIKRMEKYISGTTVAHLSDKDIKKIKMLLSTDNVLEKFSNQMEIVNEKIGLLHQQNKSLVEMRDLLINKLIK